MMHISFYELPSYRELCYFQILTNCAAPVSQAEMCISTGRSQGWGTVPVCSWGTRTTQMPTSKQLSFGCVSPHDLPLQRGVLWHPQKTTGPALRTSGRWCFCRLHVMGFPLENGEQSPIRTNSCIGPCSPESSSLQNELVRAAFH